MTTDWSLDFCLVCDRQTLGGAYCSQACRLAELDKYSTAESEPPSPTTSTGFNQPWSTSTGTGNNSDNPQGLHLGPAIDFISYKGFQSVQPASLSDHTSSMNSSRPTLTPSSSHTSLSSLASASSGPVTLPGQVKTELEEYAGCFDHVRDWKRRLTAS